MTWTGRAHPAKMAAPASAVPQPPTPGRDGNDAGSRTRSIRGVGTGTAAFLGPTRRGPVGVPGLLTGLADFERVYGDAQDLALADVGEPDRRLNFVAHAVRAYFENGGKRLYVVRTARQAGTAAGVLHESPPAHRDDPAHRAVLRAPSPGASGNGNVMLRLAATPVFVGGLGDAPPGSLLGITVDHVETLYVGSGSHWVDAGGGTLALDGLLADAVPGGAGATALLLTLSVEAVAPHGSVLAWSRIGFAPAHPRWLGTVLAAPTPGQNDAVAGNHPLWADIGRKVSAFDLVAAVRALPAARIAADNPRDNGGRRLLRLAGGSDGAAPVAGRDTVAGSYAAGLAMLAGLDDIATVAAPGSSAWADGAAIQAALVAHAARPGARRMAVLDSAPQQTVDEVRTLRAGTDSSHAAFYYPWVVVAHPDGVASRRIALPPSGFVAGLYARNDAERGVHMAPANAIVRGALRFERELGAGDLNVLQPLGINCFRVLEGWGLRLWGARLACSDPAWQYVPLRRYMNYLEASLDRGMRWTAFERNGEPLWAAVRQAVGDFLLNEWQRGALRGTRAEDAFFVQCDRSTLTQDDLDSGRLVCVVGVAPVRPAEFVVIRIGQWTADAKKKP